MSRKEVRRGVAPLCFPGQIIDNNYMTPDTVKNMLFDLVKIRVTQFNKPQISYDDCEILHVDNYEKYHFIAKSENGGLTIEFGSSIDDDGVRHFTITKTELTEIKKGSIKEVVTNVVADLSPFFHHVRGHLPHLSTLSTLEMKREEKTDKEVDRTDSINYKTDVGRRWVTFKHFEDGNSSSFRLRKIINGEDFEVSSCEKVNGEERLFKVSLDTTPEKSKENTYVASGVKGSLNRTEVSSEVAHQYASAFVKDDRVGTLKNYVVSCLGKSLRNPDSLANQTFEALGKSIMSCGTIPPEYEGLRHESVFDACTIGPKGFINDIKGLAMDVPVAN